MVHITFLLKTSHHMDHHKIWAQKLKIWFLQDCKKSGFQIKERREPLSHWQRDPHVRLFFLTTETAFTGDFSATARSPAKPRVPMWSPDPCEPSDPLSTRRSHRKWLAVDHGGSRRCSALRRSSQAGRARPRVSYSTSELWRSFLGRWLGLKRCGMSWPRESRTPTETRRCCALCLATVSAVERPPSGANVR